MSYKYQRLRERIKEAIATGELAGKLPGERELARTYHANAKTLSKALADLITDGLIYRSIGRGTFVREKSPQAELKRRPWILVTDADSDQSLIQHLHSLNPRCQCIKTTEIPRPKSLSQYALAIDLACTTDETFIRNLLIRSVPVILVGPEPRTYSTHGVYVDLALAATMATRDLLLAGHRKFMVVERKPRTAMALAMHRAVEQSGHDCTVDVCDPQDVLYGLEYGATACVVECPKMGRITMDILTAAGVKVPQEFSVTAVGWGQDDIACTGYYVPVETKAAAVSDLLQGMQNGRPSAIWLTAKLVERGTVAAVTPSVSIRPAAVAVGGAINFPMLTLAADPPVR